MNETKHSDPRVLVALDFPEASAVMSFVDRVTPDLCRLKVGKELFTAAGPQLVENLAKRGFDVFLDLKFHDIPNTVANAVTSATGLGVFMMTVHTIGGREMMEAAVKAAQIKAKLMNIPRPFIVGVTVLTSAVREEATQSNVLERAKLAKLSGLDGVVASVEETAVLRQALGYDVIIVTPGIRPSGTDKGDQKRVATPAEAVRNGSSFLVVGRPVVTAKDPQAAAQGILNEIREAK